MEPHRSRIPRLPPKRNRSFRNRHRRRSKNRTRTRRQPNSQRRRVGNARSIPPTRLSPPRHTGSYRSKKSHKPSGINTNEKPLSKIKARITLAIQKLGRIVQLSGNQTRAILKPISQNLAQIYLPATTILTWDRPIWLGTFTPDSQPELDEEVETPEWTGTIKSITPTYFQTEIVAYSVLIQLPAPTITP